MSYIGNTDFFFEVAKGNVAGHRAVNKFGATTNADNGVATDVWDRANVANNQAIWVAPTQARTHNIASTSSSDDGSPAGVGAQTATIFGLPDWDTAEVSETITLNGTSNVATTNSYVIIHRMFVSAWGATNVNVGTITATAQTDGTVTAQIDPGYGQTQMAIYGVPSVETLYVTRYFGHIERSSPSGVNVEFTLLLNHIPDTELTNFRTVREASLLSNGSSALEEFSVPPTRIPGPAILKVQVNASANDAFATAGFDGVLVEN